MTRAVQYPSGFIQAEQQEDTAPKGTTLHEAARTIHEDNLADRLTQAGLQTFLREYLFAAPHRKFRADFAFVDARLLIEIEGGIWSGGRHTRGQGYTEDLRKYNLAGRMGFLVLRYAPEWIYDGSAVEEIQEVLRERGMG